MEQAARHHCCGKKSKTTYYSAEMETGPKAKGQNEEKKSKLCCSREVKKLLEKNVKNRV